MTNRVILQTNSGLRVVTKTPPATQPVTLAEAKVLIRVETEDDDTLIESMIESATQQAEQYLNRRLITQTIIATWANVEKFLPLPYGPVVSITEVKQGGVGAIAATTAYSFSGAGDAYLMINNPGQATSVEYVVGYGATGASVPQAIRQAILMTVATDYENRENFVVESGVNVVNEMPNSARRKLDLYKVIVL